MLAGRVQARRAAARRIEVRVLANTIIDPVPCDDQMLTGRRCQLLRGLGPRSQQVWDSQHRQDVNDLCGIAIGLSSKRMDTRHTPASA